MKAQETERQPKRYGNRCIQSQLTQADFHISCAQAQIKANIAEAAYDDEAIETCVQQDETIESAEMGWPRPLKITEFDNQPKHEQYHEI